MEEEENASLVVAQAVENLIEAVDRESAGGVMLVDTEDLRLALNYLKTMELYIVLRSQK